MSDSNMVYIAKGVYDNDDDPATLTDDGMLRAVQHQISVENSSGTIATGTIALAGVPFGQTTAATITDESGVAVEFDLSTLTNLVIVDGKFESLVLTPSTVSGAYTVYATGIK